MMCLYWKFNCSTGLICRPQGREKRPSLLLPRQWQTPFSMPPASACARCPCAQDEFKNEAGTVTIKSTDRSKLFGGKATEDSRTPRRKRGHLHVVLPKVLECGRPRPLSL